MARPLGITAAAIAAALAACSAGAPPAEPTRSESPAIDAAVAALATDGWQWAYELRSPALVRGTLQVPEATLSALADPAASDRIDMAGNRVWSSKCGLAGVERVRGEGGPAASVNLYIHERDREDASRHLRDANGRAVWLLGVDSEYHTARDLHVAETTAPQFAAVCQLFDTPIAALVDGFARRDPRIDDVFAEFRARRINAQQVITQLEPWDERWLPALLQVMVDAIASPRPDDRLDEAQDVRLIGYVAGLRSTFDVACFASQALRGFPAPPGDDAVHAAEVRSLAVWLRLSRIADMPSHIYSRE